MAGSRSTPEEPLRLVIAIDYGTTFTGVAIAFVPIGESTAQLRDIKVLREWGASYNEEKVPSVYSYTKPKFDEEQWGASLSEDAEIMVCTKLELDAPSSRLDELGMILDNLDGMRDLSNDYMASTRGNPDYTSQKPELVVLDYMKKVFDRVWEFLGRFDHEVVSSLPVDIVITHPTVWSNQAQNATYRAVTMAGFNKNTFPELQSIMMVTESEAAAVYTARYLAEAEPDKTILEKNDVFILCDAAGVKVTFIASVGPNQNRIETQQEVVTFQVLQLKPTLELKRIGEPHSRKCGSVFVDGKFKQWLRDDVLGPDDYEILEPNTRKRIKPYSTTGRKMRDIMKVFIEHKHAFTGDEDPDHLFTIELPTEFRDLNIEEWVEEGLLTSNGDMMEWLFEECVDDIVSLLKQQREEAMKECDIQGVARIKTILMIGGFVESNYLHRVLREEMDLNDFTVQRPANPWSAVVRGAALYGIEKNRLKNYMKTETYQYFYAVAQDIEESSEKQVNQYRDPITDKIMGKDRLTWIVHPGELAFEDYLQSKKTLLTFNFREHDKKDITISIYRCLPKGGFLPARVGEAEPDLKNVLSIPISLSDTSLGEFEMYQSTQGQDLYYYQCVLSLYLTWKAGSLRGTVVWDDKVIYPVKGSERE